jgi:hypothetical protein
MNAQRRAVTLAGFDDGASIGSGHFAVPAEIESMRAVSVEMIGCGSGA